jgi:hypothetical protein
MLASQNEFEQTVGAEVIHGSVTGELKLLVVAFAWADEHPSGLHLLAEWGTNRHQSYSSR